MTLRAVLFDLDDTLYDKSATHQLTVSEQFTSEKFA
jgi:FMN phosphatase YigB (HAD superfamily)